MVCVCVVNVFDVMLVGGGVEWYKIKIFGDRDDIVETIPNIL